MVFYKCSKCKVKFDKTGIIHKSGKLHCPNCKVDLDNTVIILKKKTTLNEVRINA